MLPVVKKLAKKPPTTSINPNPPKELPTALAMLIGNTKNGKIYKLIHIKQWPDASEPHQRKWLEIQRG